MEGHNKAKIQTPDGIDGRSFDVTVLFMDTDGVLKTQKMDAQISRDDGFGYVETPDGTRIIRVGANVNGGIENIAKSNSDDYDPTEGWGWFA